jgi:hypothetical protein
VAISNKNIRFQAQGFQLKPTEEKKDKTAENEESQGDGPTDIEQDGESTQDAKEEVTTIHNNAKLDRKDVLEAANLRQAGNTKDLLKEHKTEAERTERMPNETQEASKKGGLMYNAAVTQHQGV